MFVAFGDDIEPCAAAVRRARLRRRGAGDRDDLGRAEYATRTCCRLAYARTDLDDDTSMRLADGTPIDGATPADWERNGWRVQVHGSVIDDADVCVAGSGRRSASRPGRLERPVHRCQLNHAHAPSSVRSASRAATARGIARS